MVKKNNTYYKPILNKNTLQNINQFKVRLSSSNQLYTKDSLNYPNRLGFNPNQLKYYHICNIRAVKIIGPQNKEVLSVIIGSLLGDGSANNSSGECVIICYKQNIRHKESITTICQITKDPNYITGFEAGEACFRISICKRKDYKTGWRVIPTFTIELHTKDASNLYQIQ